MRVTDEQMNKIKEVVTSSGYPNDTFIGISGKIVTDGNNIVAADSSLDGIIKEVVKPKEEKQIEKKVVKSARKKKKKILGVL